MCVCTYFLLCSNVETAYYFMYLYITKLLLYICNMDCCSALAMQCGHCLGAMLRICGSYVIQNALGGHLSIYDI